MGSEGGDAKCRNPHGDCAKQTQSLAENDSCVGTSCTLERFWQ